MTHQTLPRPHGQHLAFEEHGGSGDLVLLLPGIGDLRSEYRFLTPALLEAGYRVVSADLRGHGDSSAGFRDYSVAAVADDILSLVDHLGGPASVIALRSPRRRRPGRRPRRLPRSVRWSSSAPTSRTPPPASARAP